MNPITYLKTLASLYTQPTAFPNLLKKNLWFVIRFFLISMFVISLIESTVLLTKTFPAWIEKARTQARESIAYYPENLVISWDQIKLDFDPSHQIELPYPEQLIKRQEGLPPLFGVVIPQTESLTETQAQELDHPEALLYLTSKNIYLNAPSALGASWTHESLDSLPGFDQPFTVTASTSESLANAAIAHIETTVTRAWPFILLIMFGFILITKTWSLIWYALVGWLFYRFNAEKMSVTKVIKLTLYITVVAQTLNSVAHGLYPETSTSYIFSLSYMVIFFIFFLQLGKRKV